MQQITVIGGGLSGSEAAWQIAARGVQVRLYEMRPNNPTGAHVTGDLAELVCSNSLGSQLPDRATGILMSELEHMGSLLLQVAREVAVPAGGALAVDREGFAARVTDHIRSHPNIQVIREEVQDLPSGTAVLATGPLTSPALAREFARIAGQEHLYFFDAISPIVEREGINFDIVFRASRYGRGERKGGDYLNCPLNQAEYLAFVEALQAAERIPLRDFEREIREGVRSGMHRYFEACLPIEVIAERGDLSLAYGPLRPVGLVDPRTGKRPYAVVQLRQDDLAGDLYNLVGFQTNLRYPEQRRVFRMIPGLEGATFARYGQMHRNTFINAPRVLKPTLQFRANPQLFLAGQLTGVEGYTGNIATGFAAGFNAARLVSGLEPVEWPRETMLGALLWYVTHCEPSRFQPMKANLGILPALEAGLKRNRRERAQAHAARSCASTARFWESV